MPLTVPKVEVNWSALLVTEIEYVSKLTAQAVLTTVKVGEGLTTIVKFCGEPAQLFAVGVTVMVAVTAVAPMFEAVNAAILPVPLAAKPMLDVLFTHP